MLSRREGRRGRARWLLLVLLLCLLAAAAGGLFAWRPWRADAGRPGRPGGPKAPAAAHCPDADLTGLDAASAAAWRELVEPVHEAACAGDFGGLARLLGGGHAADFRTEECNGCSATAIVAMWRDEYGLRPSSLARLLETRPVPDQGGLVYAHGDLAAVFARGTHDLPGVWSAFYLRCRESVTCAALRPPGGRP